MKSILKPIATDEGAAGEVDLLLLLRWRREQAVRSGLRLQPIDLKTATEWSLRDGRLCHRSGGFFSIVGLRWEPEASPPLLQPFILQPEIGILGFLCRRNGDTLHLLVQAKTEPGNPFGVQLAPTFQCTESNYLCLHGGTRAPYFDCFDGRAGRVLADSLQSEQGSRFLGKYNRNLLVEVADWLQPAGEAWQWLPMPVVLRSIATDLLFNTDARSVLAVSPWEVFCSKAGPFAARAGQDPFIAELRHSYCCEPASSRLQAVMQWLSDRQRSGDHSHRVVPLDELPGWSGETDQPFLPAGAGVGIRCFQVEALDREVPRWQQPLLYSDSGGDVLLATQVRDGVLRLLVQASAEPGYENGAQLAPGLMRTPGSPTQQDAQWEHCNGLPGILDCLLSEEGGRFHQDINRYRIVQLAEGIELPLRINQTWLTLGEITALKTTPGVFSNEFRSALSLLLQFVD